MHFGNEYKKLWTFNAIILTLQTEEMEAPGGDLSTIPLSSGAGIKTKLSESRAHDLNHCLVLSLIGILTSKYLFENNHRF